MNKSQQYSKLLKSFSLIRRGTAVGLKNYTDLLKRYINITTDIYDKNRKEAPDFNPFSLFNLTYDEITHSNMLAWLLDPKGTHNQGDLFLKSFFKYLYPIAVFNLNECYIKREHRGNEATIDILVSGKDFIVYIENKTLSIEGDDQTNREYRDLMRKVKMNRIKNTRVFPVFVSPSGDKPKNPHWRPISYSQLAIIFEKTLDLIDCLYVKKYVESWIKLIRGIKGGNINEIIE